jgi:type I restriction enzyme, S subunit
VTVGEWDKAELGKGSYIVCGQHILADQCSTGNQGIPYLTGPADFPNGRIVVSKYVNTPKAMCKKNDLLLVVKGSGVGKLIIADDDYCISRQLVALRAKLWDSNFLYQIVLTIASRLNNLSAGTIPGITKDEISEWVLPLPPLPEQKKIAEILSCWDEAIETIQKLIDAKTRFKKGLMQRLFAQYQVSPAEALEGGYSLGQLFQLKQGTYTTEFVPDGVAVWGANGKIGFSETVMYSEPVILVSCRGEYTGVVHYTDEPCWVSNNSIALFSPKQPINPKFVFYLLGFHGLKRIVSGSAQPQIIVSDLNRVSVQIPSLERQVQIVEALTCLDLEVSHLTSVKGFVTTQKQALMQQLLTGKIRVKTDNKSETISNKGEYALNA